MLVNLFREPLGAPMRPGAVNELLAALSRRAGLERGIHPHMLRHCFGSNVLEAGGAVDEVQALLGHYAGDLCQVDRVVVRYRRAAAAGVRLSSWPISAQVWPWSRAS